MPVWIPAVFLLDKQELFWKYILNSRYSLSFFNSTELLFTHYTEGPEFFYFCDIFLNR